MIHCTQKLVLHASLKSRFRTLIQSLPNPNQTNLFSPTHRLSRSPRFVIRDSSSEPPVDIHTQLTIDDRLDYLLRKPVTTASPQIQPPLTREGAISQETDRHIALNFGIKIDLPRRKNVLLKLLHQANRHVALDARVEIYLNF
jgi:hypothetical protein